MILIAAIIFSSSCELNKNDILTLPTKSEIFGLASPINLNIDETKVILDDYFIDSQKIDSIDANQYLSLNLSSDKKELTIKVLSDSLPRLSLLNFYSSGHKYTILVKKSEKIKYKYSFNPKKEIYKSVAIKGEMNAWNPNNTPLKLENGVWTTDIIAEPGTYQYLIVADGKEMLDPANKDSISNKIGGFNSLMKIGKINDNKAPYLQTSNFNDHSLNIKVSGKIDDIFVFVNNTLLSKNYTNLDSQYLHIIIPADILNIERTYIRIYAYNKFGASNDIKIPLKFGKVIDNTDDLTRTDYESAVIYNVFVDRFYNGDSTNDEPINDPKLVLPPADFHGGDITGVIHKLNEGYFDSLGVNTIWLSPIVKNIDGAYGFWPNPKTKFSAYHGYWPISFTEIDKRFGTSDEFQKLVDSLHSKNYNILLDFIAHHVHKEAPIYKEHPSWTTNLYLPDGTLNTERWDDYRLTTWFDVFLPTLDNSIPEVADIVSDSAVWWIKNYSIDGFRHDAAKHVPLSFWRTLTYKIKHQVEIKENKKIYQIGETYGTPELISSYVNSGMLNAQFDFNVYDQISTALAVGNSFKNVQSTLMTSLKYYGYHNLMGYITGNQDRGRFISYAGGTLKYDEDAKLAGWTRDIEVGDSVAYNKSAMLFAFIGTIPGIPVIYYGDEIGMPGGNDPDSRRDMVFNNLNNKQIQLKNTVTKIIKFRRSSMPLIYGDFKFLQVDNGTMIYQRTYFSKIVLIFFNNTNKEKTFSIKVDRKLNKTDLQSFNNYKFDVIGKKIKITIPANSFEIINN